jgi:hypothetical protein
MTNVVGEKCRVGFALSAGSANLDKQQKNRAQETTCGLFCLDLQVG